MGTSAHSLTTAAARVGDGLAPGGRVKSSRKQAPLRPLARRAAQGIRQTCQPGTFRGTLTQNKEAVGRFGLSRPPRRELTGALRRSSVKKNVGAGHVAGKLSLLQRKLVNALLLNAYDTLVSQQTHRIDARVLCELTGFNSIDTETLKTALRGLAETVAEWNILDDSGADEEWAVPSLLAYARLKASQLGGLK